jgi:hypothetical protein
VAAVAVTGPAKTRLVPMAMATAAPPMRLCEYTTSTFLILYGQGSRTEMSIAQLGILRRSNLPDLSFTTPNWVLLV